MTKPKGAARLKILNVQPESWWAGKQHLPRAMVGKEHSTTPCDLCPGNCCGGTVHANVVEAARIALLLAVPLESVVRTVEVDKARDFEPSVAIKLDAGKVRLALLHGVGNRCRFLLQLDGRGRCSIHGLRPGVCRIYPFHLDDGASQVKVGTLDRCPVGWLQNDATVDAAASDLARWRANRELDRTVVTAWNRGKRPDRSFAALCRHVVTALAPALGGDPARLYPQPRRRLGQW